MSQSAFRAAGQALAALWQGAPIDHVDIDGIALDWPDEPTRKEAREQAKIEIAIGLAGIVAQDRYRFGWVPGHEFVGSWQFDESQLQDFHLIHNLVAEIETDDADLLYRSWSHALKFVSHLANWPTVELLAEVLEHRWLIATEVEKIAAHAFWDGIMGRSLASSIYEQDLKDQRSWPRRA